MFADFRYESTLGGVASDIDSSAEALLFAVVVDCSEPTPHRFGYLTKLKVVDPSFNFSVRPRSSALRFSRFCHVNVTSATREAAPRVRSIGDVIRLRRFKFEISDRGELVAFERVYISNWLLFSAVEGERAHVSAKGSFPKNVGRALTDFEWNRLQDLRCWARRFFADFSIASIIWWNPLSAERVEGVDLLLKTSNLDSQSRVVCFFDAYWRRYILRLSAPSTLSRGEWIKLRCVDTVFCPIERRYTIALTSRSSCMLVPKYAFEARETDFRVEERRKGFASAVGRLHSALRPTSVRTLLRRLRSQSARFVGELFVVEATVARAAVDRRAPNGYAHFVLALSERRRSVEVHFAESLQSVALSRIAKERNRYIAKSERQSALANCVRRFAKVRMRLRLALRLLISDSGIPFYRVVDSVLFNSEN